MAKRRFKFGDLKNLAKLADQFLEAGEHVHDQVKDKDAKEILDLLKNNVSALKNPKTMFEVQRALRGKSPKEIKEFVEDNFKDLSSKDAADLAKALSEEKGLPGFLSEKLAPKKEASEPTPPPAAEEKQEAITEPEAEKVEVQEEKTAPKKPASGGLPWGKILGTAWDAKQKLDQNRQKEDDKPAEKGENDQNNQKDNKKSSNNNQGRKPS